MAAAPAENASLAALQARVVASGGPAAVKAGFAREWLRFQDALMPAWAIGPNGKLSLNAPASASRADAYAGFFKPRIVEMEKKPLLYFCAFILLASDTDSTCFSERMHSPAGRIMSKFRASMKPQTAEKLTLAYFLVRAWIKAQVASQEITEAGLDAAELAEEAADDAPALDVAGVMDLA